MSIIMGISIIALVVPAGIFMINKQEDSMLYILLLVIIILLIKILETITPLIK